MTTPSQVRSKLIEALKLDLVGPSVEDSPYARETLTQAPSKWYLTGFLAPYGAAIEQKLDDTVTEEIDQQTGSVLGEDSTIPETTAARRVPFPSSMGLSFLISEKVNELEAQICWGDYVLLEEKLPESTETQTKSKTVKLWQRQPQNITVTIPLAKNQKKQWIEIPDSNGLQLVVVNRAVKSQSFPPDTRSLSVFLVNYRNPICSGNSEDTDNPQDVNFVFQTSLSLKCSEGFIPRANPRGSNNLENSHHHLDWDEAVANLQYRNDYEFAVGHNVSAIAYAQKDKCKQICTIWLPTAEVPSVAPTSFDNVELSMEEIAAAPDAATITQMVSPLVTAYQAWIVEQKQTPLTGEAKNTSNALLDNAERAAKRIVEGLDILADPEVSTAFKIANRVIAIARRQQLSIEQEKPAAEFTPPKWRPFQLAFILLNLGSIAKPEQQDREIVDLLFFPTGGGKTEAYLGLAAFTLVLRRLRNPDIQGAGLSVLMRYTLRLLTLDQLERASRLICALELERSNNPSLGDYPFEIGLWVGSGATPNKMGKKGDKDKYSARQKTLDFQKDERNKPSPIPLEKCPWCGTKFTSNSFQLLPTPDNPLDLKIICSKRSCDFKGDRPLPIVAVDEPIYRRLPCFIIATVDKFANLPWVGQTGALFGKVTHYSKEKGFSGPADGTPIGKPLPAHLPPPDLIIQDEVHLISGPLGTMVGLYETAIDSLSTSEINGKKIRPKIIASTATVRRAERQIQALFGRSQVDIFPPPGPNRHDSFFAKTELGEQSKSRLYLGVAAQGRSPKVIMLKVYLALLASAQKQWEEANAQEISPNPADPYMTLLGYFGSLRELGGSRRIVEDEINPQLSRYRKTRVRYGETISPFFSNRKIDDEPEELTSRVSTNKVAATKNHLSFPFSYNKGRKPTIYKKEEGVDVALATYKKVEGVDVALATNMISVGLDIVRLGLMVVLGQPKSTAEYIQSTSRVGRDVQRPGLVVTLLNIHRPRDRSHYERFQSWHTSFYRAVEATSVTPFSPRALDRGLAGVVVALARLTIATMTNPIGASQINSQRAKLEEVIETISRRAEGHNPDLSKDSSETLRQEIRAKVNDLLDTWAQTANQEKRLQYNKDEVDAVSALLLSALDPQAEEAPLAQQKFKAQRSLRDVEPTVNLWIQDMPESTEE